MTDTTPLVAVHLVIGYQAVCHDCGWESPWHTEEIDADAMADRHDCAAPE